MPLMPAGKNLLYCAGNKLFSAIFANPAADGSTGRFILRCEAVGEQLFASAPPGFGNPSC